MISIHDIIAFIEYEKYFQSVERAEERTARAATAASTPDPAGRVIQAGRLMRSPLSHAPPELAA